MEKWSINRKTLEIIIICVATFIIAIFSVTYAYFENQIGGTAQKNTTIKTDSTDVLNFNVSKDISLTINQFNFGVGVGNLSDNATATASLKANNTNNTASYTYYVYFKINTNGFTYTTSDSKPEILLTITNPSGQAVTSISGLTYKSNVTTTTSSGTQTVSGFDITNKTGTFAIASAYTISSNSSTSFTTQNWTITATFINLDTDQQANAGKNMGAEVIIQQEELKTTLAEYVISTYTDGSNGLYYHTSSLANSAGDNSYRYAGANPNNYVCFGSDAATCPSDNLYRIIGVFGSEVKLIKSTSYGNYAWATSGSNTWSTSSIRTTLNSTYLSSLSATWQNKIATHTWKVGGMAYSQTNTAKQYYDVEVGSSSSSTTDPMKIGLMYVSDYGFAASNSYWTMRLYDYDSATSSNWLYLGSTEWTIARSSSNAFTVRSTGFVNSGYGVTLAVVVRPSFYLTSSTTYVSGSGSSADPIRIS